MTASHLARSERRGLCDLLVEFGPDAPTLCEGWLTKDLAAHLFVRERRPLAMPGIVLGSFADLTEISMQAALRSHGYEALVSKVRSGPPLLVRPLDDVVNLAEYFVHTEDVRRAASGWEPRNDPQLDIALWASLGRWARMLTRKLRAPGWCSSARTARRSSPGGPSRAMLSGGAQELVLFLHDRREVARVTLSGPEEALKAVNEMTFGP